MLIVFSDSKQLVTADQKVEINAVMKEYSGLIDTVVIDIVEGFPESGETTDTKLANAMAKDLQVSFTPYMIFVDRYGRITWRFNGYTDRKLLEREILRATQ